MSVMDKFNLTGKKAWITGGTRGIGKVAAMGLAQAGADIAIIGTDIKTAQKTADEVAEIGVKTIAIQADVRVPEQVDAMMEQVLDKFGTIDIAFNNAGIVNSRNAEAMSYEQWKEVIDINLTGVFLTSQAAGREMIKKKSGSIINMASMSAHIINVPIKICHYHASKAGVIQMTKSMAAEWAPYNVRVNSISPGYILTELVQTFTDMFPIWTEKIPMGRLGKPEELQGLVLFLASDASSYITGADIIADGGYTIW